MTVQSQRNSTTGGMQGDVLAIEFDLRNPNRVVVTSDGGVFASPDTGNSWAGFNSNLSLTQFYHIALHPTDDNYVFGGSQDKGVLIRKTVTNWDYVSFGDGGDVQIDFAHPSTLHHPDIFMSFERSDDGGQTWQKKETGLNKDDRSIFIMPVTMDPSDSATLYLGSYRLYKTTNRGENWSPISGDLTNGESFNAISAIAIAKSSSATIYVGTSDGNLYVTTNGGATFRSIRAGLPLRFISRIAVDPVNAQIAYVSLSGFGSGHVFKTTNGENTWSDISGNLPDIPVNALTLDPFVPSIVYIGTDNGVFVTTDGGATWAAVGPDTLPHSPVFDLKTNKTGSLVAATFGRGAFKLSLTPPSVVSVSGASYTEPVASEPIVSAFGASLATDVQPATTIPLPTTLAGTSVQVKDSAGQACDAPLFFVSPTQINYQMPMGLAAGIATVNVTSGGGVFSVGTVRIGIVAPGLFTANANGQGPPAAIAARYRANQLVGYDQVARFDTGQKQWVSSPIDFGPDTDLVFLLLFGTGVQFRSSLAAVTAKIGGVGAVVWYAGPQGDFVGLDQINIQIPRSLAGRGEVDLVLMVDGQAANTVRVNIK